MVIVTMRHLDRAAAFCKDAAKELSAWTEIVSHARWANFTEARATFPDADAVDGYVVFNIRHNRYRLITVIHYSREINGRMTEGHCYIRSFLTHQQYNNRANWDKEYGQ